MNEREKSHIVAFLYARNPPMVVYQIVVPSPGPAPPPEAFIGVYRDRMSRKSMRVRRGRIQRRRTVYHQGSRNTSGSFST